MSYYTKRGYSAPSTILPVGVYSDFTDESLWQKIPSYWWNAQAFTDHAEVHARNAPAVVPATVGISGGFIFKPLIMPDENEELEVWVKVAKPHTLAVEASLNSTYGLLKFLSSYQMDLDWHLIGLNGNADAGGWLSIGERVNGKGENMIWSQYTHNLDTMACEHLSLKWSLARGNPNDLGTFHLFTRYHQLNADAWDSFVCAGGPPVAYARMGYLRPKGLRFGCVAFSLGIKNGQGCDFESFTVVKGTIVRDY